MSAGDVASSKPTFGCLLTPWWIRDGCRAGGCQLHQSSRLTKWTANSGSNSADSPNLSYSCPAVLSIIPKAREKYLTGPFTYRGLTLPLVSSLVTIQSVDNLWLYSAVYVNNVHSFLGAVMTRSSSDNQLKENVMYLLTTWVWKHYQICFEITQYFWMRFSFFRIKTLIFLLKTAQHNIKFKNIPLVGIFILYFRTTG